MKRYRLVVLGASFLGIGAALTEPANTVIIEPSCRLGDDYVNCLCAQDWRTFHPCTKSGKQLYSEMEKRGLLYKDGSVYAEPAIFILSKWLYQSNVSVCLSTTVTKIVKTNGGYELTIFNCDGQATIFAEKILDTTPTGVMYTPDIDYSKQLNSVVTNAPADSYPIFGHFYHNSANNLHYFAFPVGKSDSWIVARDSLHRLWLENKDTLNGWRLVFTAFTFAYKMPTTKVQVNDNHNWIPSCSFPSLLEAFDEGGCGFDGFIQNH